jgi:hypothetical protein
VERKKRLRRLMTLRSSSPFCCSAIVHELARLMSQSANASGPHFPRALARVPTVFFLDSMFPSPYARHTVTLQFSDACSSFSPTIHPLPLRAPKVCPWPIKSQKLRHTRTHTHTPDVFLS